MTEASAVKSLRYRYIIGLSAIALLVTASFVAMHLIIGKQERYSYLIFVAGQQSGLANRIAHFAGQMVMARNDDDYAVSRAQLGRAANAMAAAHDRLIAGDEAGGLPKVMTPLLHIIYYDEAVGLDMAVRRFLGHARDVYDLDYGQLTQNSSSYVYLINYGPHVLEPMLASAVEEYESFSRGEIKRIEHIEAVLWVCALVILMLEAVFIYRPLESKVRATVEQLEHKAEELEHTIDEIERTRQDMERQKNLAERANQSKGEFLSNMSHELRTPLNAIIGFSSSLQAGVYGRLADPRQDECLRDITASGNHLLALINDILDLSAAEAERLRLHEATEDLAELVEGSLRIVESAARRSGVRLASIAPEDLPRVYCDGRRITQVLLNLLSNAIKFTPRDGSVTVQAGVTAEGRLQVAVADTGVGMTAEEVEIALSRFGQIGNPMNRQHQGTGLGLPLAMNLAKLHNAEFRVESQKGEGTRVSLTFPMSRLVPHRVRAAAEGKPLSAAG